MTYLFTALQAEILKIRKSKVIWITALAFTLAPLMAGFFMFVLKNPEFTETYSLLGAKAQIAGEANWPSYIKLHAQMISVGGMLGFGFVTSWIFGREYADRTIRDLLALPYSRAFVILAKFIASFLISLGLSIYIIILGFLIGWIIELPQFSSEILTQDFKILIVVTFLTVVLSAPVAFFACCGKGYMAPLGFVVLTLVLSQMITAAGFGEYFPWAIPAIYGGITDDGGALEWNALFIVVVTSLLGIVSTIYWLLFTDQY